MGRLDFLIRLLEPPVLGGDLIQVAAEPLDLLAEGFAPVVGRCLMVLEAGDGSTGRVGDEERLIAMLAADLLPDIAPPHAFNSVWQFGQATTIRSAGLRRPGARSGPASRRGRRHPPAAPRL